MSKVIALDLLYPLEHFKTALAVRYLFDDDWHLGLDVLVIADKVLAPADELLIVELLKGVEIERLDLFARTPVHTHPINIYSTTPSSHSASAAIDLDATKRKWSMRDIELIMIISRWTRIFNCTKIFVSINTSPSLDSSTKSSVIESWRVKC